MPGGIVDRRSGVPLYRQLADHIKRQIASGVCSPGDILPSEADYIRDLGLSRMTVRLAFGLVANAGLVRREQGRGTIILSQMRSSLPLLASFSEEARRNGREPSVKLVGNIEEPVTSAAARALSLPSGTKVTKIIRLRLVDRKPIGLAVSWLNTTKFPSWRALDYSTPSLYEAVEKQLGLTILSATETVLADIAEADEARRLRMKPGSPVLRLRRTTFVQGEQDNAAPVEYTEAAFNGSAYSVDIELYRKRTP
jgi:DNA-binding GntR family transcriptional regulator